jgi:hypothetical protein
MRASLIRRSVSTARAVRAVVAQPPYVPPGHFYSPLSSPAEARRCLDWNDAPGVDLNEAGQLALAARLAPLLSQPQPGPRYLPGHNMFGAADAAVFGAMLAHLRPARLLEVGSGYSTAVALDAADSDPGLSGLEITCVEPYPERLLALLRDGDRVTLLRQPVQDLGLAAFDRLEPGDVLFIDSTHVLKAGSDVAWLFLRVLPRLAAGVTVHVHDVFWPFGYPAEWVRQRRDWTEAYLLHAFLIGNQGWEILLFPSWLWQCHPELVPGSLAREEPGSIWLRKCR